jgi:hypothetical protein
MTEAHPLQRIVELAAQLSPSLLPVLDHRALTGLHTDSKPADMTVEARWPTKQDFWPYGEAAWFIRGVLLAVRDHLPDEGNGAWLKTAWFLEPPEPRP